MVRALGHRRAPSTSASASFSAGLRLAGEGGLLHLQARALDQPSVRRDAVALGEQDDVAAHDLLDRRSCARCRHAPRARWARPGLLQRLDRLRGAQLGHEPHRGVHGDDHEDGEALDRLADHERDRRGGHQEEDDQARELVPHDRPDRRPSGAGSRLGPSRSRRRAASSSDRPRSRSVSSSRSTSPMVSACQSASVAAPPPSREGSLDDRARRSVMRERPSTRRCRCACTHRSAGALGTRDPCTGGPTQLNPYTRLTRLGRGAYRGWRTSVAGRARIGV